MKSHSQVPGPARAGSLSCAGTRGRVVQHKSRLAPGARRFGPGGGRACAITSAGPIPQQHGPQTVEPWPCRILVPTPRSIAKMLVALHGTRRCRAEFTKTFTENCLFEAAKVPTIPVTEVLYKVNLHGIAWFQKLHSTSIQTSLTYLENMWCRKYGVVWRYTVVIACRDTCSPTVT